MTAIRDKPRLSTRDMAEFEAFNRFLLTFDRPGEVNVWEHPGWLPYVFGWGPPPPEGYDDVPITAWTLPG